LEKNDTLDELETLIGTEAANRIAGFYSGTNLYIPKHIINERKYQKIRDEFKNGASYRELARRYGYSEQHIRRIVHKKRQPK
jgi:Mor family transcriptional regulator